MIKQNDMRGKISNKSLIYTQHIQRHKNILNFFKKIN